MSHMPESRTQPTPAWFFGLTEETLAPLGEYMQSYARRMTDWNGEISRFVGERMDHTNDAWRALAQCDSVPQALQIEGTWLRVAMEDYLKESRRLMELNGGLFENLFASASSATDGARPTGKAGKAAA